MMRRNRRRIQILAGLLALVAGQGARASDIPCNAPVGGLAARCEEPYGSGVGCEARPQAGVRKGHLICEYTMLSQRYELIYAEQQRRLRKGTLQAADLAAWRARRDACDSVRCMDTVFHEFWRQRNAMPKLPEKATVARQDARSAAVASHETPVRPAMPASAPSPAKAAPRSAPTVKELAVAVHPLISVAYEPEDVLERRAGAEREPTVTPLPPAKPRPVPLMLESLASGLAVLGVGAGFVWKRRRAVPQAGKRPMRGIAPVMMIAYGLFLVNAMLLPFTLGLR